MAQILSPTRSGHGSAAAAPVFSVPREEEREKGGGGGGVGEREREAASSVREQLQEYLDGVKGRTDENGSPVVAFPKNFDSVVEVMGRQELLAEEYASGEDEESRLASSSSRDSADKSKSGSRRSALEPAATPWARYLLQCDLNAEGPYAIAKFEGVLSEEERDLEEKKRKIAVGIATIRRLDAILEEKTRATAKLESERRAQSVAPSEDGDDSQMSRTESRSARPGSSSASSYRSSRRAFMTQRYGNISQGSTTTSVVDDDDDGCTILSESDASEYTHQSRREVNPPSQATHASVSVDRSKNANGRGNKNNNFIRKNISAAGMNRKNIHGNVTRLTQEQEERVSNLVSDNDGSDGNNPEGLWAEICHYGPTKEDMVRLEEVEKRLEEQRCLGHLPPRSGDESLLDAKLKKESASRLGETTLREAKSLRVKAILEKQIDEALNSIRSAPLHTYSNIHEDNGSQLCTGRVVLPEKLLLEDPVAYAKRQIQPFEVRLALQEAQSTIDTLASDEEIRALLEVLNMEANRIKFEIDAISGGNTRKPDSRLAASTTAPEWTPRKLGRLRSQRDKEKAALPSELAALFNQ